MDKVIPFPTKSKIDDLPSCDCTDCIEKQVRLMETLLDGLRKIRSGCRFTDPNA